MSLTAVLTLIQTHFMLDSQGKTRSRYPCGHHNCYHYQVFSYSNIAGWTKPSAIVRYWQYTETLSTRTLLACKQKLNTNPIHILNLVDKFLLVLLLLFLPFSQTNAKTLHTTTGPTISSQWYFNKDEYRWGWSLNQCPPGFLSCYIVGVSATIVTLKWRWFGERRAWMDYRDSHCPHLLSCKTTAKGTGLAESVGKENPVELDSSSTLGKDIGSVLLGWELDRFGRISIFRQIVYLMLWLSTSNMFSLHHQGYWWSYNSKVGQACEL